MFTVILPLDFSLLIMPVSASVPLNICAAEQVASKSVPSEIDVSFEVTIEKFAIYSVPCKPKREPFVTDAFGCQVPFMFVFRSILERFHPAEAVALHWKDML